MNAILARNKSTLTVVGTSSPSTVFGMSMDEGLSAWVSRAVYTPRPDANPVGIARGL